MTDITRNGASALRSRRTGLRGVLRLILAREARWREMRHVGRLDARLRRDAGLPVWDASEHRRR